MLIYLDLCCLKRPFDDQRALRIRLEAEAVLAIEGAIESGLHTFVRSIAHDLENEQNPDEGRRSRVAAWLDRHPVSEALPAVVLGRTEALAAAGFPSFDALHLAWAERLGADAFVTVDDRLLSRAASGRAALGVRVLTPIDLVKEGGL